ncbi:MAG: HAD family hydrolase [Chloroflexi bacterium]|nr:HAD family hydrolase [Chloroflexota bacterium]
MKSPDGIRAIFFDLDGTLRHSVPLGGDVFSDHVAELGLPITSEDRLRAARWEHYYWASSSELLVDRRSFQDDDDAFWGNYVARRLRALGVPPKRVDELTLLVRQHMQETYQPENWVPPELHELLPELRQAGYTLAVVSNRTNPFDDVLDELGLTAYFDLVMAAGEVDAWKPDPEIFEHAMQRANVTAEQTLYIGDNYYADVVGARNAGVQPVLYDRRGIFPNADCPVITSFTQLPDFLDGRSTWRGNTE